MRNHATGTVQNVPLSIFSADPNLYRALKQLGNVCIDGSKERRKEVHTKLVHTIASMQIVEKIKVFDARQDKIPQFKVVRQYMRMVMELMIPRRLDTSFTISGVIH